MSLNGLDTDAVVKAHQAAQAEAGAWFLLKYASRDTVELLGSGSGGVAEARSSVESYQEKSPLYGMVHYRRKRVVLKYVPEGISRLLQVRLAVQFQSITDTLIPHDHIFTFAAASELTESTLGLATMQLQAGGSLTSSTSSLRGRRLDEIAEDSEDASTQVAPTDNPAKTRRSVVSPAKDDETSQSLLNNALQERALLAQGQSANPSSPEVKAAETVGGPNISEDTTTGAPRTDMATAQPLASPSTAVHIERSLPPRPSDVEDDRARPSLDPLDPSVHASPRSRLGDSQHSMDHDREHEPFSRYLPEAESSSISRWTDDVLASTLVKPKQKRAPRPHVESGRPKTSGTSEDSSSSKRANLPNSIRVSTRPPSGQSTRPGSQQSSRSVPIKFVPSQTLPPPLPSPRFDVAPVLPQVDTSRQAPSVASSAAFDGPAPSPEKLRLMKALQMRKRAQLRTNRPSAPTPGYHAPVSSIGSSISAVSSASAGQMSAVSALTEAHTLTADTVPAIESSTTSPTSVITVSEDHSTKPSSVSELSSQHDCKSSLSSGSNSSTTPKADASKSDGYQSSTTSPVKPRIDHDAPANNFLASLSGTPGLQPEPHIASADQNIQSPGEDSRGRRKPELTLKPSATGQSISPSRKRYKLQNSFNVQSSAAASDLSDSESFMEELQNATLQEAKPISVNRSPVTPVLSRHADRPQSARAPTAETRDPSKSPATTPEGRRAASRAGSTRSISTALPQWPPPGNEPPVPALPKQKVIVSSGISKRVKAFEGLKNKDVSSPAGSNALSSPSRASTFTTILKRTSFFSQGQNSSVANDKGLSGPSTPVLRPDASQSAEEKLATRPWIQRPGSSSEVLSPSHKNETVTITARIVRDEQRPKTSIPAPSEAVLNLRRSPLIIEHETNDRPATRPQALTAASAEAVYKRPSSRSRRFSFTSLKSNTYPASPVDTSNRFSSTSSQKRTSRAMSETSSIAEDKRASRASRLLKRLSGIGGRKNRPEPAETPTHDSFVHPDTIHERSEMNGDKLSGLQVVDIGEVNVQFPETLLWKRRFLRVDDQGHILFAPPSNDFHASGKSRKYHLSDFRSPALPDVESQEMAWSIILALKDGRNIQVACESKHAQRKFLKLLLDAHNAYTQLYGD